MAGANLSTFAWSVADLLSDVSKQAGKDIQPFATGQLASLSGPCEVEP